LQHVTFDINQATLCTVTCHTTFSVEFLRNYCNSVNLCGIKFHEPQSMKSVL